MPEDALVMAMIPGRDGKGEQWMELERGRLSPEAFWQEACIFAYEQYGVRVDPQLVIQQFISVEVPPSLLSLLQRLHDCEFPMCIVTNGFRPADGRFASLDQLRTVVSDIIESYAVGLRKPEQGIFDLALNHLQCSRSDVLYLDDTAWFVSRARLQKIQAICVTDADDTTAILKILASQIQSK
jgi:FMN phosphatase YigB (HAD superfamily)